MNKLVTNEKPESHSSEENSEIQKSSSPRRTGRTRRAAPARSSRKPRASSKRVRDPEVSPNEVESQSAQVESNVPQQETPSRESKPASSFSQRQSAPLPPVKEFQPLNVQELLDSSLKQLQTKAEEYGATNLTSDKVPDLVRGILKAYAEKNEFKQSEGFFDLSRSGFGFLRSVEASYQPRSEDVYVPPALIKRYNLKPGDHVVGVTRSPRQSERYQTLVHVDLVWNQSPQKTAQRKPYDELTPLFPQKRLVLETSGDIVTTRAIDLLAPLGRGQRALIVAPPRAGKTVILQQIAQSLGKNNPDVYVIVLLLDERPEEVGNMRPVVKNGEVIASTFDETPERHVRVAEFVMEKAHRMIENGLDVVVLMDSLTRYARACNNMSAPKGKLMSGGVEASALLKPRKFFSSARNVEEGGSLTIVATVLTETGSKGDDLIFEEFKGTGNMEVHLSRDLQERRIYPAINIEKTGTRREDLLYHPEELRRINALRKSLAEYPPLEAMEKLIEMLRATSSNAELLMRLKLT